MFCTRVNRERHTQNLHFTSISLINQNNGHKYFSVRHQYLIAAQFGSQNAPSEPSPSPQSSQPQQVKCSQDEIARKKAAALQRREERRQQRKKDWKLLPVRGK